MSGERGFGMHRGSSHSVQQKHVVLLFVGPIGTGGHFPFHRVRIFALIVVCVRYLLFYTSFLAGVFA